MNNKYKLILVGIFLFVLTGCQADYEVKINLDGTVEESAVLIEKKSKLVEDGDEEDYEKYLTDAIKLYDISGIDYDISIDNDKVIYTLKKKYSSLSNYLNSSKAYEQLFKNIKQNITNSTKIYSIASEYDVLYFDNDGDLNFENSTITVSLPFKVVNNNANYVDNDTNTYIWNINDDFISSGFELEYSNKYYTYNPLSLMDYATVSTYLSVLLGVIIVALLLCIFILGIKMKRVEKNEQ